jgi:hypothetical protein
MQAGVWFHTSRMYGDALEVLGEAFKEDPTRIPRIIINWTFDKICQKVGTAYNWELWTTNCSSSELKFTRTLTTVNEPTR